MVDYVSVTFFAVAVDFVKIENHRAIRTFRMGVDREGHEMNFLIGKGSPFCRGFYLVSDSGGFLSDISPTFYVSEAKNEPLPDLSPFELKKQINLGKQ